MELASLTDMPSLQESKDDLKTLRPQLSSQPSYLQQSRENIRSCLSLQAIVLLFYLLLLFFLNIFLPCHLLDVVFFVLSNLFRNTECPEDHHVWPCCCFQLVLLHSFINSCHSLHPDIVAVLCPHFPLQEDQEGNSENKRAETDPQEDTVDCHLYRCRIHWTLALEHINFFLGRVQG